MFLEDSSYIVRTSDLWIIFRITDAAGFHSEEECWFAVEHEWKREGMERRNAPWHVGWPYVQAICRSDSLGMMNALKSLSDGATPESLLRDVQAMDWLKNQDNVRILRDWVRLLGLGPLQTDYSQMPKYAIFRYVTESPS